MIYHLSSVNYHLIFPGKNCPEKSNVFMNDLFEKYVCLLKKYWLDKDQKAGGKEWKELSKDESTAGIYRQLDDPDFLLKKWKEYSQYPAKKGYQQFCNRIGKKTVRWPYWSGVAAAAILIFVFGNIWLDSRKETVVVALTDAVTEKIEPGSKKATLKLADGKIVNIGGDSMQIREKKGAVIDYAEGRISYQPAEKITELVYNELIVPVAGECYITLDDGIKVWLNSDSRLKYPLKFIGKERKVFLEGEAFFEVVPDRKPFIVHTALGEVNVLGTVFDVKAYQEENKVYTTLVSGKVNFKGRETLEIQPGEQVIASGSGEMLKRKVNLEEFIGWKEGIYVFKEQTLGEIMNDLARWYDVAVFYRDEEVKRMKFTGNLKRYDHINTFMQILQRTGEVKYTIQGNTIMLYR